LVVIKEILLSAIIVLFTPIKQVKYFILIQQNLGKHFFKPIPTSSTSEENLREVPNEPNSECK
jgi:hypothetical protein